MSIGTNLWISSTVVISGKTRELIYIYIENYFSKWRYKNNIKGCITTINDIYDVSHCSVGLNSWLHRYQYWTAQRQDFFSLNTRYRLCIEVFKERVFFNCYRINLSLLMRGGTFAIPKNMVPIKNMCRILCNFTAGKLRNFTLVSIMKLW